MAVSEIEIHLISTLSARHWYSLGHYDFISIEINTIDLAQILLLLKLKRDKVQCDYVRRCIVNGIKMKWLILGFIIVLHYLGHCLLLLWQSIVILKWLKIDLSLFHHLPQFWWGFENKFMLKGIFYLFSNKKTNKALSLV